MIASIPIIGCGAGILIKNPVNQRLIKDTGMYPYFIQRRQEEIAHSLAYKAEVEKGTKKWGDVWTEAEWTKKYDDDVAALARYQEKLADKEAEVSRISRARLTGKILTGIGAALVITKKRRKDEAEAA